MHGEVVGAHAHGGCCAKNAPTDMTGVPLTQLVPSSSAMGPLHPAGGSGTQTPPDSEQPPPPVDDDVVAIVAPEPVALVASSELAVVASPPAPPEDGSSWNSSKHPDPPAEPSPSARSASAR